MTLRCREKPSIVFPTLGNYSRVNTALLRIAELEAGAIKSNPEMRTKKSTCIFWNLVWKLQSRHKQNHNFASWRCHHNLLVPGIISSFLHIFTKTSNRMKLSLAATAFVVVGPTAVAGQRASATAPAEYSCCNKPCDNEDADQFCDAYDDPNVVCGVGVGRPAGNPWTLNTPYFCKRVVCCSEDNCGGICREDRGVSGECTRDMKFVCPNGKCKN